MAIELEDVINHLTGPQRLPIKDIYERLGLTRGLFQSRRRSSDPKKRSKLGEEIIAAYPEYFPDGVAPSSNTARRSFATNAVLAGIPALEVMKFTGHRSMASFLQYVRITGQETAVTYANHPFFNQ